jgi:hypothetical protein
VVPFHPAVAVAHRNRAVVAVVRQPTRRRVRVQRLCFSVAVKVQAVVLAVFPGVAEPRHEQVRRGPEGRTRTHSQRTSGRSVEYSLLQEGTAH